MEIQIYFQIDQIRKKIVDIVVEDTCFKDCIRVDGSSG